MLLWKLVAFEYPFGRYATVVCFPRFGFMSASYWEQLTPSVHMNAKVDSFVQFCV